MGGSEAKKMARKLMPNQSIRSERKNSVKQHLSIAERKHVIKSIPIDWPAAPTEQVGTQVLNKLLQCLEDSDRSEEIKKVKDDDDLDITNQQMTNTSKRPRFFNRLILGINSISKELEKIIHDLINSEHPEHLMINNNDNNLEPKSKMISFINQTQRLKYLNPIDRIKLIFICKEDIMKQNNHRNLNEMLNHLMHLIQTINRIFKSKQSLNPNEQQIELLVFPLPICSEFKLSQILNIKNVSSLGLSGDIPGVEELLNLCRTNN